jgi:Reverse transcriptase (RNA-dependent DNA polymerase)
MVYPQNQAPRPLQVRVKSPSSKDIPYNPKWPPLHPIEIRNALFKTSDSSAPGPDGLPYKVLKQVFKVRPKPFINLFMALFNKGYHPLIWRQAIGFILPKAAKPDYSNPKAYRVISLLSCLGKVLEKVFANRLAYLANTDFKPDLDKDLDPLSREYSLPTLLHPSQLGGRKQRSAIDACLVLTDFIQKELSISNKRVVSTLFLDIKGAFDHVKKERLLAILTALNFPSNLIS